MATQLEQSREVKFPINCKSANAKKKYKDSLLLENPNILYCDYIHNKGKKIKNNLIFHTDAIAAWKTAICEHYKFTVREGVGRGGRIIICSDESLDTDNPVLTVTYYTKGTFLFQGNEASLISFEEIFLQIKPEKGPATDRAQQEEAEDKIPPSLPAAPPPPPSHTLPPALCPQQPLPSPLPRTNS